MTGRCPWAKIDLAIAYHDTEWGVPVHDDRKHFEFIILDGAQAGLSWDTILKKRENYRRAYDGFDVAKVARYGEKKIAALLADEGIVRNRLKVVSSVQNARAFIKVAEEFGTFDEYIWQFTGGGTIVNRWESMKQIAPETDESRAMSRDLRKRGFNFVGPTICYAYMQAAGMVNDHLVTCPRHSACRKLAK